jgi:electron transport complex protein RnfD
VRQLWRALHTVPQLLLVQPEQLRYDLAYALALLPLIVAAILFFLQDALLIFAMAFLAGIVCLLAIQLARLTFGLPAWVGFKATHPLVASVVIACFCPPLIPAWVVATAVILFVILDTLVWPQLQRVMLNTITMHPALIIFGLIYLVQRQLGVPFINAFDGHRLDDPLALWYKLQIVVDPVKLYVGNVSGPIGVTSAGAVLLGLIYLWYTRKVSLGVIAGFVSGVAVVALVLRSDIGFQLASGPSLYVAGYIAADRRRVLLSERFTFLFGVAGGVAAMLLRWYGTGLQGAWMGLLLASLVVTVAARGNAFIRGRARFTVQEQVRTLRVESGQHEPRIGRAGIRPPVPQPVMAASPVMASYGRGAAASSPRAFDPYDPNDLVRQMRSAAGHSSSSSLASTGVLLAALLILNPVGLWLTWRTRLMAQQTKLLLSAASVLWYLGVAGLGLALVHR